MSIDILKTLAVQGTRKLCDEHEIEQNMKTTMANLSDFYKAQAEPIAHELIASGLGKSEAWDIAYNQVRRK